LKHASRILEHLSAFPELVVLLSQRKDGVDVLVDLLVNFRAESEVSLSSATALRMWCLHGAGVSLVIRVFVSRATNIDNFYVVHI
jgi:hypothetical protein